MSLADCPSNLKEAIDWILRVTGKDGQGGGNIPGLAKAIKQVFSDAIGDAQNIPGGDRTNGDEFKKLWEGLLINLEDTTDAYTVGTNSLIGNLAEGLRKFIGYKATILDGYHGGLVTGAGIAPSNIATHRLCDAAIAFTIGVLEKVRETTVPPQLGEPLSSEHKNKIDAVISKLYECYGKGPQTLPEVETSMSELTTSAFNRTGIGGFVDGVRKAFETNLKSLNGQGDSAENVAEKIGAYLKAVLKTWVKDGASGVDGKLKELGSTLKSTTPYDPTNKTVSQKITSVNGAIKTELSSNISHLKYLIPVLKAGKSAFMAQLENKNKYVPTNYQPAGLLQWNTPNDTDVKTCAKIFLGCLPLIFSKLSYLYWRCHDNGGGWNKLTLYSADLKDFLFGMDYHPRYLNRNKTGQNIVQTAMNKNFPDFSEGMNKAQEAARTRAEKENKAKESIYQNAQPSPSNQNSTYPEFLDGCKEKLNEQIKSGTSSTLDKCPLSALHLLASCYFRCMQSKRDAASSRPPSTIREMLYFLAALPYSPNYDSLDTHISNYFKKLSNQSGETYDAELMIAVADSSTNQQHNTLSAADLKYHLVTTCSFSSSVLGLIQGHGASEHGGEPWLYELYCNSAYNLTYSTGAALFNAIAKYTYAVQFQLLFLYFMCSNDGNKCGWNNCTYGREVNSKGSGETLASHICPGFKCNDPFKCGHNGSGSNRDCKHNNYGQTNSCGKASPSALQAFLTDGIQGMCRLHPGSSHHLSTCAGSLCHVPMGFKAERLRQTPRTGNLISLALQLFCGSPTSPLRQLCEKLGCLTNRTPRTLGDVFGFIWHLNYQLFKTKRPTLAKLIGKFETAFDLQSLAQNFTTKPYSAIATIWDKISEIKSNLTAHSKPTGLSLSLESMAPAIPFLYQLFMAEDPNTLPGALFDLTQHCHKVEDRELKHKSHDTSSSGCSSPNDLWSMYQPLGQMPSNGRQDTQAACRNAQCGGYLYPLTHSDGSTYDPKHASSYLSWLLYLTDDFEIGLRYMLDDFKNIDCKTSGCGGKTKCFEHHPPGTHGTNTDCTCDSVVYCGGVLPLLYRYGFKFYSPYSLSGDIGGSSTKRNCKAFADQLQSVLAEGAPLTNLLTTIDDFLYAIRWEFFSKLSAFWTVYICIILYTFFFLLDTLRVRSHLHFPSSNRIAPISLLGTGKAPALTKLTKLTYFIP